jgi:AcrR family transcriptional regulator
MTGAERREQLLGIARTVFAEKGYEATSIEDIAERAGVTRPVVYEHFGGKEGIHAVVVDREVTRLSELLGAALREGGSSRLAAELAATAFLGFIEEDSDGFRILIRDAPAGSGRSLASVLSDVAARTAELLAAAFEQRGLDPEIAPMYAQMLVGAVAQVGEWWLEVGEPPRDVVAAHIINLMWNGLSAMEADPQVRDERDEREGRKGRGQRD